MLIRSATIAATMLVLAVPLAQAGDYAGGAVRSMKTDKGEILTDAKGMTLYVFDKDSKDKSACNGKCAMNWPPLMAATAAKADGNFSLVTRQDGKHQWAYDGKPLYLWKNDGKPGDMTGDGIGGVWHVAKE